MFDLETGNMKKIISFLVLLGVTSACATIKQYNKLEQPEGTVLTASIGSTIFRLNKSSDLPNVFGKADLWGGKVDRGFTELKLKGISDNGNLMLQITDLNLSSTETTMDRYDPFHPVSVDQDVNIGTAPVPDQTTFEFNPKKEDSLAIGGVRVTFIEVKPYNVMYKLTKEIR